jgi:hypothetical protein
VTNFDASGGPQGTPLVLLWHNATVEVSAGTGANGPVTLAVLSPAGAADPAVRAAFAAAVEGASAFAGGAGTMEVQAADFTAERPWMAARHGIDRSAIDALLAGLPAPAYPQAVPSGPAFSQADPYAFAAASRTAPPIAAGPTYEPGPAMAPAGPPRQGRATVIVLSVIGTVLLLCVGLGVVGAVLGTRSSATPTAGRQPGAGPSASARPEPSVSATASAAPEPTGEPTLRPVPARSLVGPTYGPQDRTYTMDIRGWPFVFRTGPTWGCMGGTPDLPNARGLICIDEENDTARQRIQAVLRSCPTTCTTAEQQSMNADLLDQPATESTGPDGRTWYQQAARNDKGLYELQFVRFFADTAGGPLRWQVGVLATSPPETSAVVQKTVNDIYTQTP